MSKHRCALIVLEVGETLKHIMHIGQHAEGDVTYAQFARCLPIVNTVCIAEYALHSMLRVA